MMKIKLIWLFVKWSILAGWYKADWEENKNVISLEKAKMYDTLSEACVKILEGKVK